MDAGHILVGVMTSAAVGWLIWLDLHSRRNTAAQKAQEASAAAELTSTEDHNITPGKRAKRTNKSKVQAA